jgi:serine/threonine-protein kinase
MQKADTPRAEKSVSMSPERWERIKRALTEALQAPQSGREEAIRKACGGDPALEVEVRDLIAQTAGPLADDSTEACACAGSESLLESGTVMAGRFRLIRLVGRGGMGQVWEAFDEQLRVGVAIKTLLPELLRDSKAVERFQREVLTARGVTHPNICRVHDLFVHTSGDCRIPFLTMQLIAGESLAQRLKRGPLPETEAVAILEQCASALDAAHRAGVVHRDFKPANVMLPSDHSGEVLAVVTDFGLARPSVLSDTASMTAAGTPGYMPPEQMAGREVQASTDVYSFAVVACEVLTGKRPFDGGLEALPSRWRIPIRKALDVEPDRRISSPAAMLAAAKGNPWRRWPIACAIGIAVLGLLWASVGIPMPRFGDAAIAVLPFDAGKQDPDLQYLGDGIAGELIDSLTRQPSVHVIARESSFRFRGQTGDFKGASQALGAKYIVVGSVRRDNGHIRVSVELVDPKSGYQIWASAFDRPENEIFEVHEIVASEIASRVTGKPISRPAVRPLQTIDPEAHDLYLRGLFHFNQRTRSETLLGLTLLQQAIGRAPDYAPLYTALADCYSVLGDYRFKTPLEVAQPAYDAIQKALQLDPNLAEAYASLGLWEHLYGWDNRLSEINFQKAIRLNPGYASAHQWYSQLLYKTRRFDQARREAAIALELDPISPAVNLNYGNLLFYSRDFAGLVKQSIRQHEINPSLPFFTHHKALGLAYLGRSAEAIATMEAAAPMQRDDPLPIRIWAEILAVGGDRVRAREALSRLIDLYRSGRGEASFPAMIFAALGDQEQACDYLQKALEQRDTNLTLLDVAPPYDSLRKNSCFLAVRAKVFKETKATD